MKIAVTAASGQLGAAIIKEAITQLGKDNVIALARTLDKAKALGVETRAGDYNDPEGVESALAGVNVVLLVSASGDPGKRPQMHRNVMEAAKRAGVRKIVYTSIIGSETEGSFSSIVQSNRQTESDIQNSGLEWSIGRNGIYMEPDLEYIPRYVQEGKIWNCAGEGRCAYTTRSELAVAYVKMMTEDQHNQQIYNLGGPAITQQQLADLMNETYGLQLKYQSMSVADYKEDRTAELGEFMGMVISGIYDGIRKGVNDVESDFEKAAGRPHIGWLEFMRKFPVKIS